MGINLERHKNKAPSRPMVTKDVVASHLRVDGTMIDLDLAIIRITNNLKAHGPK